MWEIDYPYSSFLLYIPQLEDVNTVFKILDFYLTKPKYLSTFYILKSFLKESVLQEYLSSRKDLITKIVQENNSDLSLILGGLPDEMIKTEFFKERENLVLYLDEANYKQLFGKYLEGKYRLEEKILNDDRFIQKFFNYYGSVKEALALVTDNDVLIKSLLAKVRLYTNMRERMISNLNDNQDEFTSYLEILINSGIDIYKIDFLKDMIDIVFFRKRVKEVFFKYKGMNLEKIKLELLNNVIKESRESIASSITNPLNKDIVYIEYTLDDEKVLIPTILYTGDAYTFFSKKRRFWRTFS